MEHLHLHLHPASHRATAEVDPALASCAQGQVCALPQLAWKISIPSPNSPCTQPPVLLPPWQAIHGTVSLGFLILQLPIGILYKDQGRLVSFAFFGGIFTLSR